MPGHGICHICECFAGMLSVIRHGVAGCYPQFPTLLHGVYVTTQVDELPAGGSLLRHPIDDLLPGGDPGTVLFPSGVATEM
jgi:hypothetical protein